MSSKKRRTRTPKPAWERGYSGHVYWQGRSKLGKVTLHSAATAKHKYTWEAAGRAGAAEDLEKAKRAVEAAAAMANKQLDLFG
jgi:hypothetical protein